MSRIQALLLIIIVFPSLLLSAQSQPPSTADEVLATKLAIQAAGKSGDKVAWDRLVAPDCVFVEPGGRIETRAFHAPRPKSQNTSDSEASFESSEMKVSDYGDTAVLTFREDSLITIGGNAVRSAMRFMEIYKRSAGKWQLISSAETPIPLPNVIKVDPKVYDDYVGDYQITPAIVGKVYREADKLMLLGTGWKQPYQLLPTAPDTFVVKGMEQNEIMFVRDTNGKVTGQSARFRGQPQPLAKKIK